PVRRRGGRDAGVLCGAGGRRPGLLVVQHVPGASLHGRHRRARTRRSPRARRRRREAGAGAVHHGRRLRDRDRLGDHPGRLLQDDRPAHFSHGAAAPSLRAEGLGGAESHRPLLDHYRDPRADRARELEDPVMVVVMHKHRPQRPSREDRKAPKARTLVLGPGETGLARARYLTSLGEPVLVIDSRQTPPGLDALRGELPDVRVELGTLDAKWLAGATRIVWSPGLASDLPLAVEARRRGIEIVGDIELFARATNAPVIAVTGSHGKSTVTALTAYLLEGAGYLAPAGGNLGPPALELLAPRADNAVPDAYVLEISSFQMETTESLRPLAAAVLNVSADHLDRHGDIDRYAALKAKLLSAAEHAVFNRDDPHVRSIGERCARPIPFSVEKPLVLGWSVLEHDGERWLARDGHPLVPTASLALRGRHNEANALAALA